MERVYLVGLPGSGKTTIGEELANAMGYVFMDLDLEIEKKHGSIEEIFKTHGEKTFREIEREMLVMTLFKEKVVVACGGGTPCFYNNMDWMNWNGVTLYLKRNIEALIEYNGANMGLRPMFLGLEADEMHSKLDELGKEREQYYAKSALIFETNQHFEKSLSAEIQGILLELSKFAL